MLDFEGTQTTYVVEVTAMDPFGKSASTMVTITVTDENEPPEVTPPGDPCEADTAATPVTVECDYDENGMDAVASFSGMDPEGEMIAWSLAGNDAGDFSITGGELTFNKSPNFEDPADADTNNEYLVTVVATEVRAPGSLELAQSTGHFGDRERRERGRALLVHAEPAPGEGRVDCDRYGHSDRS